MARATPAASCSHSVSLSLSLSFSLLHGLAIPKHLKNGEMGKGRRAPGSAGQRRDGRTPRCRLRRRCCWLGGSRCGGRSGGGCRLVEHGEESCSSLGGIGGRSRGSASDEVQRIHEGGLEKGGTASSAALDWGGSLIPGPHAAQGGALAQVPLGARGVAAEAKMCQGGAAHGVNWLQVPGSQHEEPPERPAAPPTSRKIGSSQPLQRSAERQFADSYIQRLVSDSVRIPHCFHCLSRWRESPGKTGSEANRGLTGP
jgi:hypothetical protein